MIKLINILAYEYRVAMSCHAHSMYTVAELRTRTMHPHVVKQIYVCGYSSCIGCECGEHMWSIQRRSLVVRGELAGISSALAHLLAYV